MISYSFFLGIRTSRIALAPVPGKKKRNIILNFDYKNISISAYVYNLPISFYVLVTFCVLIDYLVILSFSEIGATQVSFSFSILSLGDTEFLVASSSSK